MIGGCVGSGGEIILSKGGYGWFFNMHIIYGYQILNIQQKIMGIYPPHHCVTSKCGY